MRRFYLATAFVLGLCWLMAAGVVAGEYKLTNGDIIRGEPASFNDEGFVVRLDIGGFSPRINWSRVTQESLVALAKNPEAAKYADPFIEVPLEVRVKERKKKDIVLQPVPRVEQPEKASFFGSFTSPIGLVLLIAMFVGNIYAGYSVAHYRNRPVGVVCAVSAILPVAGPLLFLSMPTLETHYEESVAEPVEAAAPTPAAAPKKGTREVGQPSGGGLSLSAAGHGDAAKGAEPAIYKRGDFTFNRRFFETKFPGFFRVVPSEAEKDLVLAIKMVKGEHIAKRISRISMTEMHVQLLHGGNEVGVPFAEIAEVRVRNKDAKA